MMTLFFHNGARKSESLFLVFLAPCIAPGLNFFEIPKKIVYEIFVSSKIKTDLVLGILVHIQKKHVTLIAKKGCFVKIL